MGGYGGGGDGDVTGVVASGGGDGSGDTDDGGSIPLSRSQPLLVVTVSVGAFSRLWLWNSNFLLPPTANASIHSVATDADADTRAAMKCVTSTS